MSGFYAPPAPTSLRNSLPPIYPSILPTNGGFNDTPSASTVSTSSPRISLPSSDHTSRDPYAYSTHLPSYFQDSRREMLPPSYRSARPGSPRGDESRARDGPPGLWDRPYSTGPPSPGAHLLDDVALPLPPRPSMPYARPRNDADSIFSDFEAPDHGGSRSIADLQGRRREVASYYDGPGESSRPDWGRPSPSNGGGGGGSGGHNGSSRPSGGGASSMGGDYYPGEVPEPIPASAGYPGSLYDNVPLPDGQVPSPSWGMMPMEQEVGGAEFAQALQTYEAILGAIPHVRPAEAGLPPGGGQAFETLVRLAQDGVDILSGQRKSTGRPPSPLLHRMSSGQKRSHDAGPGKAGKPTPKCLGCGATETPEWRRGPMGPRTLCNACGLVHIKLQRKRKKMEEKEAAEAAKKSGSGLA